MPTAFSPLGGLSCPHKKEKKRLKNLRKLENTRKNLKFGWRQRLKVEIVISRSLCFFCFLKMEPTRV